MKHYLKIYNTFTITKSAFDVCMYVCIYLRSLKLTAFMNEKWLILQLNLNFVNM